MEMTVMRHWKGFTVHSGGKAQQAKTNDLRSGCAVIESGIYRVLHSQHRLPAEITLIRDHSFPRCSKCSEPVYFELVRSAPFIGANPTGFTVRLYELPELAEQDESVAG
jgi:hypothetical protein